MNERTDVPFGEELRAALGAPSRARVLDSSPRSRVWRVELPDAGPAVVKQLVDGPEAAGRYARETAALKLAGRAALPVAPRLLGTDDDARLLVMELLDHRPPTEGWQVAYAQALARLHACALTAPAGELAALPSWSGPRDCDIDSFLALAHALEATVPAAVREELDGLVERLGRPPLRPALLHGDPCPGNDLHTPDGIRFVDFEQASLGSGLMELAYVRIGFPTCWCVTAAPAPLLDAAEAAYRSAWRDATGTEQEGDLADACAGWLIRGDALVRRDHRDGTDHLARLPHRDWTWGTASARGRLLHRLDVVARMTEDGTSAGAGARSGLGALGRLATEMAARIRARWPRLGPVPVRRPE
ncbi:aminoglycoside phosphotransferase family protein [Streptomyces lushanensis]|uniref:aminoglycoside phosphotransferase family protein n=1 Tax=Streptomyces lushanensis TaxID=1434255 RepID=UPI0008334E48|nr:aminoglycoside phosphotransferase family protein [Streptomyces lushanensis]